MSRFIVALAIFFATFFAFIISAEASDPSPATMASIVAEMEAEDKAAAKAALADLECSEMEEGAWQLPGEHDPFSWTGKVQKDFFAKAAAWAKKNCKKEVKK